MGRPRLFNSPEEMQVKIDDYFKTCDERTVQQIGKGPEGETIVVTVPSPARYTVPGLAYHLGFSTRFGPAEYASDYPEYSHTITRARLRIEGQRIQDASDPDTRNSNGIKFDLSNNFKYKDLQTIEIASAAEEFMKKALQIILEYVPADKQSEVKGKIQSSIDFD